MASRCGSPWTRSGKRRMKRISTLDVARGGLLRRFRRVPAGIRARVLLGQLAGDFLRERLVRARHRRLELRVAGLGKVLEGLDRELDLGLQHARVVLRYFHEALDRRLDVAPRMLQEREKDLGPGPGSGGAEE